MVLWADTFNNYFHPETSRAALEVLAHAGFSVIVPQQHLCCGRPLYDFGMLDQAKQYLQRIMRCLRSEIDAGLPIVVLEPSCASVFRDELRNLFPEDARAARLRQPDVSAQRISAASRARLSASAAVAKAAAARALPSQSAHEDERRRILAPQDGRGPEVARFGLLRNGGPFGFEKEKYEVSQAIGERVLLPAVRQAEPDTLIVSDGFSCREQIVQATGRKRSAPG